MADWTIPDGTTLVDARAGQAYDGIAPGDTIILPSTRTNYITFWGLQGASGNVITITNSGGQTQLSGTGADASMKLRDCEYVRITGTGHSGTTYGFKFSNGTRGLWLWAGCSDIEVEWLYIYYIRDNGGGGPGIFLNTPEGQDGHNRGTFTMDNISIHDVWIDNVYTSGMYLGGVADTDPLINGLDVYDCIVENTGTEAIQARAGNNFYIHHNTISNACTRNVVGNRTAIMCGPDGLNYHVYNNLVDEPGHTGIYTQLDTAEGPISIYNNVVQRAGSISGSTSCVGIFEDGAATTHIYNNTVVDGTGDGIALANKGAAHSCYENISVGNNTDINNENPNVTPTNNQTGAVAAQAFVDAASDNYRLTDSSPARNAGSPGGNVAFDFDDNPRPQGTASDIGAFEYSEITPVAPPAEDEEELVLGAADMATLKITDGTTEVSLIAQSDNAFNLNDWRPAIAQPKGGGTFQQSALADGRRLVHKQFDNVLETYDIKLTEVSTDILIKETQDLRRLLEKATQYWTTNWQNDPVYLEVRAENETNTRYAVIYNWSTPDDENPFAQPFLQPDCRAVMDNWTLILERGHWTKDVPGSSTCVQVAGRKLTGTYNTGTFTPSASGDDCWVNKFSPSFSSADDELFLGGYGFSWASGIRFRNVTIPQGATIVSATLRVEATDDSSGGTTVIYIYSVCDDTPVDFSSRANLNTNLLNRCTAPPYYEVWIPDDWTTGNEYDSPDFSSLIQQVIDLDDWDSGDDIAIYLDGWGSPRFEFASWDHVTADAPELILTWLTGESTPGHTATCDNEIFIANRDNTAQLSHIYVYDDGIGYIGGNYVGHALPWDMLPAVPAVDDAIYFGTTGVATSPSSGPFASLIFDIGIAGITYEGTWEYSDGVAGWPTLDVLDSTSIFQNTGVNGVYFEQPDDWATETVNGTEGYWVRMRITTGGGTRPTQQNRDVYTVNWGSALIDAAQVGGDIPAIARVNLFNESYGGDYDTWTLDTYRVIMGLRSTERGASFSAYLNCAEEQNPTGLTVTAGTDSSFVADTETATGYRITYSPASLDAWYDIVTFGFASALADDFYGDFHAYLRAQQSGGATGEISFRLKIVFGSTTTWLSEPVDFDYLTEWQTLDLGMFNFPGVPVDDDDVSDESSIVIQAYSTSATPDAYLYDLVIIPADEWIGDLDPKSEKLGDSIKTYKYLDIDSLDPRFNIRSFVRNVDSGNIASAWANSSSGPLILQNNKDQRLWILSMELDSDDSDEMHAPPHQTFSIQLFCNQRYLSMRGAR